MLFYNFLFQKCCVRDPQSLTRYGFSGPPNRERLLNVVCFNGNNKYRDARTRGYVSRAYDFSYIRFQSSGRARERVEKSCMKKQSVRFSGGRSRCGERRETTRPQGGFSRIERFRESPPTHPQKWGSQTSPPADGPATFASSSSFCPKNPLRNGVREKIRRPRRVGRALCTAVQGGIYRARARTLDSCWSSTYFSFVADDITEEFCRAVVVVVVVVHVGRVQRACKQNYVRSEKL